LVFFLAQYCSTAGSKHAPAGNEYIYYYIIIILFSTKRIDKVRKFHQIYIAFSISSVVTNPSVLNYIVFFKGTLAPGLNMATSDMLGESIIKRRTSDGLKIFTSIQDF
jgi:hypothetical protein